MMFIMSRTILSRIFKFISIHLSGFWELWLFNYPFDLTIYFSTLNLMDWHGTKGDISFHVSITHVSIFISIWFGNTNLLVQQVGYRIWVSNSGINGREGKWPRIFPKVLILFSSDSWVTLCLPKCMLTHNFYPWRLTCSISYWRVREELGWERKNIIFQL